MTHELTNDEREEAAQDQTHRLHLQRLGTHPDCRDPDHPGCGHCDDSHCQHCGEELDDDGETCPNAECAANAHKMPEDAEIEFVSIGRVDKGVPNGHDQYLLVVRADDDMTPAQAHQWALERYYDEGGGPGTYFCKGVAAVQVENTTNQCICTIHHRYDV